MQWFERVGSTGEATSFSLEQRRQLMTAYAESGLPLARCMVGTGAAAVADAIVLTQHAADLGFAAALVLPPFYYKGVPDEGLGAYVEAIVSATVAKPIPLYLYHFPSQSGVPWHPRLVRRLIETFGHRLSGLKDFLATCPMPARWQPSRRIFGRFSIAVMVEARDGAFAGCISATANLNADLCGRAWREGDKTAYEKAVAIRKLFDGKALVPGIKAVLSPTFTRISNGSDLCLRLRRSRMGTAEKW